MKYEYEAVSGNQDVFKHNESGKAHTATISSDGKLTFWITGHPKTDVVIAERKVKEVKLPVVGDLVMNKNGNKRVVVYVGFKVTALEDDDGYVYTATTETFFDCYTIIDQSKQPNPVNMIEEKWVPEVGSAFKCNNKGPIFICKESKKHFVIGVIVGDTLNFKHEISIEGNKFNCV